MAAGSRIEVIFNFTRATGVKPQNRQLETLKSRAYIYPTMAKSTSTSAPALPANYEAALQELEGLISGLESGQLPLDQLLAGYQRGAQLLAFCKSKLEAVEGQIKVLEGTELKPWP